MASPKQIIADVEFILAECVRIQTAFRSAPKSVDATDMRCWLPHPSGSGHMSCGRAGFERLDQITAAGLTRAKLERRVEVSAVRAKAGELLVERFLCDRRPIDVKQTGKLISAIGLAAKAECEDLTHFIPCHLMMSTEPEVLDLGPVKFLSRPAFRRRALELVRDDRALHGRGEERYLRRRRVEDPEAELLSRARERATKRSLPFNIDRTDVVIPWVCPALGIPILSGRSRSDHSPSLDRVQPYLG